MTILEALVKLRDDLKLWCVNNFNHKLNKNLGIEESGKFLITDANGEITTTTLDLNNSLGLLYEISEDNSYCRIIGTKTKEFTDVLLIPETYNNIPVTHIADKAFENCNMTSVIISNNITDIGYQAFVGCSMKTLTIGEGVKNFGRGCFNECRDLKTIYYNAIAANACSTSGDEPWQFKNVGMNLKDTIVETNEYGFELRDGTTIKVGAQVTLIPDGLFYAYSRTIHSDDYWEYHDISNIIALEFEEGSICQSIGKNEFYLCMNMRTINIPDSVRILYPSAFRRTGLNVSPSDFYGASGVTVNINPTSNLVSLRPGVFNKCEFKSLILPPSVLHIGDDCFSSRRPFLIKNENDEIIVGTKGARVTFTGVPEHVAYADNGDYSTGLSPIAFSYSSCVTVDVAWSSNTFEGEDTYWGSSWYYQNNIPIEGAELMTINRAGSAGLDYVLSADASSYSCVGIGTCADELVVIGSEIDGKPVTTIATSAFDMLNKKDKNRIKSICVPDSITSIGEYVFRSNESLIRVRMSENVKEFSRATFQYCKSLHTVNFPSGLTKLVRDNFWGTGLTNVDLRNNINLTSLGTGIFAYCSELTHIYLPNTITSITYDLTLGCSKLEHLEIVGSTQSDRYYSTDNSIIDSSTMTLVVGNNEGTIPANVAIIGLRAFRAKTFEEISVPATVTKITDVYGTMDVSSFAQCPNIKNIYVANEKGIVEGTAPWGAPETANVWYQAPSSSEILDKINTTITSDLIQRLLDLEDVLFGGTDELVYIKNSDEITYTCGGLSNRGNDITDIIIASKYNGNLVTSIAAHAFNGNTKLTSVTLPNTIKETLNSCFANCSNISKFIYNGTLEEYCATNFGGSSASPIRFAKAVTIKGKPVKEISNTVTILGGSNFYGCTALIKADLSNLISWGNQIFNSCINLAEVIMPDGNITTIPDYQFNGCTSLPVITLPSTLTSIGNSAFSGCKALKEVILKSPTPPTLVPHPTRGTLPFTVKCTFKVPVGAKATYESADGWKDLLAAGFIFEEVTE